MVVCAVASYVYRDHQTMQLRVATMEADEGKTQLANSMVQIQQDLTFLNKTTQRRDAEWAIRQMAWDDLHQPPNETQPC